MSRPTVLFVCTHNSARSQMAEGLLGARHGDRFEAFSAGTVATSVKPEAIRVLGELDIDISGHRSKTVDAFEPESIDYVVTVCDDAREACPFFPARRARVHRSFRDPSSVEAPPEARLEAFREARDRIARWIDATFAGDVPAFDSNLP